jgi:hypothetical protein
MATETLLDSGILSELRKNKIIAANEVAIQSGDLFFAKDVLTDERRMLESSLVRNFNTNESLAETSKKTLLRG